MKDCKMFAATVKWLNSEFQFNLRIVKCAVDKLIMPSIERQQIICNWNCNCGWTHRVWNFVPSGVLCTWVCVENKRKTIGERDVEVNRTEIKKKYNKAINLYRKTQNSAENIQQSGGRATFNGCWTWRRHGRQQSACTNANHANKSANDHATFESCTSPPSPSPSSDTGAKSALCFANAKFYGITSGHGVRNARRVRWYWALGPFPMEFARFISQHSRIGAFGSGITCSSHCGLSYRPISVGFVWLPPKMFCFFAQEMIR